MSMRRSTLRRALLFIAVILIAALFCGCMAFIELFAPAGPAPSPAVQTPSPTQAPSPSPSPTTTPFSINPMHRFYRDYIIGVSGGISSLSDAMAQQNTAAAQAHALSLTAHQVSLSAVSITVCRLIGDGSGGYSASIADAVTGTGSMQPIEDGYSFSFHYDNGEVLAGSFTGETLCEFVLYNAEGLTLMRCAIEKTVDGWASTVQTDSDHSTLSVNAGECSFAYGESIARLPSGGALVFENAPLMPEAESAQG